jgi:rare lipoprotein A
MALPRLFVNAAKWQARVHRAAAALMAVGLAALLAACGSAPPKPPAASGPAGVPAKPVRPVVVPQDNDRDGPEAHPPADLMLVPDAQPQIEAVRTGGPNKPYEVLGQVYQPLQGDPPLVQTGLASWYGRKFHGRSTASGEAYNMYAMTAAHKTMPLPSYARVRNPANGREVVVRVNDRGPFHSDRIIDLSYTAALKLGLLGGVAKVEIERITYEAIRTGAWRAPAITSLAMSSATESRATPLMPAPQGNPQQAPYASGDDPIGDLARRLSVPDAAVQAAAAAAPAPLPKETSAPAQAAAKAAPGFWLQLGAFGKRDGATGFQQRVAQDAAWLAPLMTIFTERNLLRLQAGPYASRADAQAAAERLRSALQLVPAIVERR